MQEETSVQYSINGHIKFSYHSCPGKSGNNEIVEPPTTPAPAALYCVSFCRLLNKIRIYCVFIGRLIGSPKGKQ